MRWILYLMFLIGCGGEAELGVSTSRVDPEECERGCERARQSCIYGPGGPSETWNNCIRYQPREVCDAQLQDAVERCDRRFGECAAGCAPVVPTSTKT